MNIFSQIDGNSEMRDLIRIDSAELAEAEIELDAKLAKMGLDADGLSLRNPFELTAEDLAPGGFVHRD